MSSLRSSKKGFELSINVLVVIVLGLVLFGIGFGLVSTIVRDGDTIITDVNENLQEQIRSSCFLEGNAVCLLKPQAVIESGKRIDFHLGFINKGDEDDFLVRVQFNYNSPVASVIPAGLEVNDFMLHGFSFHPGSAIIPITLKSNQEHFLPIRFTADKDLPSGEYWFDVYVCKGGTAPLPQTGCESTSPNSWDLYTGSKQRIYVTIN